VSGVTVPPLCFFLGAECRWEMLNATPAGLAEQAAGGGGKAKSPKKGPPPGEKPENCQNRQAGWRKVEKKGAVVGKKKWPRDRRRHSRYEWLSAVTRCRNSFVLGLSLA